MQTTRCKFVCTSVKKYKNWDQAKDFLYEAEFHPVSDGSPENKQFFGATPSGALKVSSFMGDRFAVGQEYYLDISPAG